MNLKNEIVFNESFRMAFFRLIKQPLPSLVSLTLVETLKKLEIQQTNVFEVRDGLINSLVVKFEGNEPIFEDESKKAEFHDEFKKLLDAEFEIPLKDKIKLTEKIVISGEDIIALKPILAVDF